MRLGSETKPEMMLLSYYLVDRTATHNRIENCLRVLNVKIIF